MIILDNSALVQALVAQSPSEELLTVISTEQLHVPHLLDYEFRSALRGLVLGKKISSPRAEGARLVMQSLPLTRHPDDVTGGRAWDLHGNLNAYDATYVALAEILDCPLVTADEKIARTTKTVQVKVY
ncbi:MAG TPA: type II toxin-antitoxin system VapC family toxin [Streptosporangiaceae bacterium]